MWQQQQRQQQQSGKRNLRSLEKFGQLYPLDSRPLPG
tara:strand:- start:5 stop:115 length:111 start_codon:yes stop_codon:yes gene_type:complete